MNTEELDEFTLAYIECALWSSTEVDEDGNMGAPLDDNYGIDDIAEETLAEMVKDCADFQESNADDLEESGLSEEQQGHDFWLTRNRHGSGFWDRGIGEVGDRLTKAAHAYGGVDLMVWDGKVHSS